MAAFLTSGSAGELVEQMTTLDMIATHTDRSSPAAAAARAAAEQAQAHAAGRRDRGAGLEQLQEQQAEVRKQSPATRPIRAADRRRAGRA